MLSGLLDRFTFSVANLVTRFGIPRTGCLHVGANFGQEAETYDRLGFARVVWVEGFAPFYERLVKALAGRANHEAVKLMVSDVDGDQVTFRIASNTGSSTALATTESWQRTFKDISLVRTETVTCGRLDRVLTERLRPEVLASLRFLVLDVEGSELKALHSMGTLLDTVEYALIEISMRTIFRDGPLLGDIDRFMRARSFERVYMKTSAASGDALYRRVPALGVVARWRMTLTAIGWQTLATLRITDLMMAARQAIKKLVAPA